MSVEKQLKNFDFAQEIEAHATEKKFNWPLSLRQKFLDDLYKDSILRRLA